MIGNEIKQLLPNEIPANTDVYLKKRWNLVPNIVEAVKGYSTPESETLKKITKLRSVNYNDAVMYYNNIVKIFANSLLANFFKYKEIEMFKISSEEKKNIKVEF